MPATATSTATATTAPLRHPARPAWALSLLAALLLSACGGGGDDGGNTGNDSSLSSETATDYAADATVVAAETATALDVAVSTTQTVTTTQAGSAAAADNRMTAQSAGAQAVANVPVTCPGGGTAEISITGGTALTVLNGVFDSGEIYALTFTNCKGSAGAAALNGSLALAITGVAGSQVTATATLANLNVSSSRGSLTLAGSATWQGSESSSGGLTTLTSALSAERLSATTAWGSSRSSSFALSDVSTQRASTWSGDLLQSSSMSGHWTVSATLVNGAFAASVSTVGQTSYAADGTPSAGSWSIALPSVALGMSVGGGSATLTVDEGKNGSIERSYTVTLPAVSSAAG